MSGLGGCGYMMVYRASEHKSYAVEFGVKSPASLDPADYPLIGGTGPDLFTWSSVANDRNVRGPYSVAVPGMVAGLAQALDEFGTCSWQDVLSPATQLAASGMQVDWYATLKIASVARELADDEYSAKVFLPNGHVPVGEWSGPLPTIHLGGLAKTLQRLGHAGAADFYLGDIAKMIVADAATLGINITAGDLSAYRPRVSEVVRERYRHADIDLVPGLTAGPTLHRALQALSGSLHADTSMPGSQAYAAYASSLFDAYDHRLANLGDVAGSASPSCTTHINVADREGNLVALTITLLSLFGSKVTLPGSGILMNNGIMWFDPRPGRPNSIEPDKYPLSNMCPVILLRDDGQRFALGASGGRRIMPAVFQLISYLVDYRMSVDAAIHQPRLDVSGADTVTLDAALPAGVLEALSSAYPTQVMPNGVFPNMFACPGVACHDPKRKLNTGAAFVASPRASAWAEVE